MVSITGSLLYNTVSLYKSFIDNFFIKFAAESEDTDHQAPMRSKSKETESGLAKEEQQAFNSWAQDFFMDHGVKTYGGASDEYKNFATYLFKNLRQFIPKILSEKVKRSYGLDIAPKNLKINSESYRDLVLVEFFKFLEDHSDKIDSALVKAHVSKDQLARIDKRTGKPIEEGISEQQQRTMDIEELGFAQSYFVPRVDDTTLRKLKEKGEDISDMKVGSVDKYAIEILKEHKDKNIGWKFEGFDNNRIYFSLPDLFGDRTFDITLPFDVSQIRDPQARKDLKDAFKSGTYNFKVKRVGKNGAVLQFVEQADLLKNRILPDLKMMGLDKREINNFFNIVANQFAMSIKSMSMEEISEKFGDGIELPPGLVSEADNLAELIEMGDKGDLESSLNKSRGMKETLEKREESKAKEQQKGLAHFQALSNLMDLKILLAQQDEKQTFKDIIRAILDELPSTIQPRGGQFGLVSLLQTKPVSEYILNNIIFNKNTPTESRGKEQPWYRLVTDWLWEEAHTNPKVVKLLSDFLSLKDKSGIKDPKGPKGPSGKSPSEQISPDETKYTEKQIQDLLKGKMAAVFDLGEINNMLQESKAPKKNKKPIPTPSSAPTSPTAPGPSMKGEAPGALFSEEDLLKKYNEKLKPGEKVGPEEKELHPKGKEITPQGAHQYFRSIDERTLNVNLQRYNDILNDIIKNKLDDNPIVQKAQQKQKTFLAYLKPDLYRFVSDVLNSDLIKLEEDLSKLDTNEGLSDAQVEEWDANQEKAKDIVNKYIENPKNVNKELAEKIRQRIFRRYKQMERNASEHQSRYRTIVAISYRKIKSLEKDS